MRGEPAPDAGSLHFRTAVGLQISPDVVSRPIPGIGMVRAAPGVPNGNTVRELIQAPAALSDEDVALRPTIGHEKEPDPPGCAAIAILFRGIAEDRGSAPDVEAWNRAIAALGTGDTLTLGAAEPALQRCDRLPARSGSSDDYAQLHRCAFPPAGRTVPTAEDIEHAWTTGEDRPVRLEDDHPERVLRVGTDSAGRPIEVVALIFDRGVA